MSDDILAAWEDCVLNNVEVKEVNNKICIDGRLYSKDTYTTFPIKLSKEQQNGDKQFYTVGEIFFFLENCKLTHPAYIQKAAEMNIRSIRRPDRKAIKNLLAGGASRPTLRSSKAVIDCNATNSPAKKMKISKTTYEKEEEKKEEEKPRVRTYSRKKPLQLSRSPSKKHSTQNQGQPSASSSSTTSLFDEVSHLQSELQTQQHLVESMTGFLRDFLGLTSSQIEILQKSQNNSTELKKIASFIQSRCSCSRINSKPQSSIFNLSQDITSRNSVKFCYKAEKHPSRGWEIVKKKLSSVLNGSDVNHEDISLGNQHRTALEASLSKAAIPLKHALSVLISQMRDFNKSPNSFEEAELFCQKIVKDCLVNAVDSFRDVFEALFQTVKGDSRADIIEKWVSVSEAELRKLLLSLVKSLQTLRDIPASDSRNLPSTLFHFPEPVFSMALNPAKVTHSVVLEMYIRIGLAELRQIMMSLVGSSDDLSALEEHDWNEDERAPQAHGSLIYQNMKQEQASLLTDPLSNAIKLEGVDKLVSSSEDIFHKEFTTEDITTASVASRHSAPELDRLFTEVNGKTRSNIFKSTTGQARRSSESDSCHYSMFKASLGNTMVSSFKKQIQEKIQASSINLGWN